MDPLRNSIDSALRDRARRVIPDGMWGHMNATRLPPAYPQFFARGDGCRLWDVDGHEYIDFMCAYGPMVLGYDDADVEPAADEQRAQGDMFNGPTARLVELAELMVETIAACRLGDVPEERHRRDDGLRHDRPRGDRQAQIAGRPRRLSWRGSLVQSLPDRRDD